MTEQLSAQTPLLLQRAEVLRRATLLARLSRLVETTTGPIEITVSTPKEKAHFTATFNTNQRWVGEGMMVILQEQCTNEFKHIDDQLNQLSQ